ncbi:MAG: class II fructose-bisphosphatase [Bryobacterales bacterium]|nr:class II fructose-bisphosphatase [Bryobacterales bacterium]MBV9401283.1 class II fructose-bisphosphatase [Bryobacterales bacterium]
MERDLLGDFIHVAEEASIASARTMGQGNAEASDQAAVQAMRHAFEAVEMAGTIVIGEGERDEAPMLYIGEQVGATPPPGVEFPRVSIAVDPLEGTNLCATGTANSIVVLAASEPGGLLHAPDCYMQKIIAGPACRDALDIDAPVKYNLKAIAHCLDRQVKDLVVMVLDRPRHQELISQIRTAGARIRLIPDGDLSAGIAAAVRGAGVDAVFGTGGAPEGVLTAAALRCLSGEMVARLVVNTPELEARIERMGIRDGKRIYTARDLAPGEQIVFVASGVTEGALLHGVRFFGDGCRTHTLAMTYSSREVRFVDTVHMFKEPGRLGVRLY